MLLGTPRLPGVRVVSKKNPLVAHFLTPSSRLRVLATVHDPAVADTRVILERCMRAKGYVPVTK
jgi:hypothetical protein